MVLDILKTTSSIISIKGGFILNSKESPMLKMAFVLVFVLANLSYASSLNTSFFAGTPQCEFNMFGKLVDDVPTFSFGYSSWQERVSAADCVSYAAEWGSPETIVEIKMQVPVKQLQSLLHQTESKPCYVEVDGKQVLPTLLKQGSGTLVNENGTSVVAITCEPFTSGVEGVSRFAKLQPGECTVISSQGGLSVYSCEK